jgi:two-component system sensor histidine kinase/response regulator
MKGDRIKILYVDDEPNNLTAFKASFRRNYEIYTAASVQEAKKLLFDVDVNVIIADQRMPGTTGVEFFNAIKDQHPDPVRILLTGYTDVESLVDAINKGQIYRFIKKPWDEFELQTAIKHGYDIFQAKRELREKMDVLEKTNDELSRFIYSASHDLRSPLMSVLGIIDLSKMDQSVTDPNGYLNMIETSIIRLDGFIQKIIEYYKNSRLEPEYEYIDFKLVVEEAVEACRHQNPTIKFNTEIDQQVQFMGDLFRTGVIMNNLISNAVKYQKPDEAHQMVNLSVRVEPHRALITIEDNGIGILSAHLNNIFKMFFRTKNNNKPGTGIGLYIVKEALTRIGGTISVTSTYGSGTRFEITIPNKNEFNG